MATQLTLANVKKALNITGNYQDDALQMFYEEAIEFLKDAGVNEAYITVGIVARGVSDLWNYGASDGKLSPYFIQRAAQLALKN